LAELDGERGDFRRTGRGGPAATGIRPKLNVSHWKYHRHLDPSWDNAAWAEQHDNKAPDSPDYGDKYFDRTGKKQNDKLSEAIAKAFIETKNIDMKESAAGARPVCRVCCHRGFAGSMDVWWTQRRD
jgi:hypothetical protein